MPERFSVAGLDIQVTRKAIKHTHINVYPPDGRVTVSAPHGKNPEVIRAFVLTRLGWIRAQRERLQAQARESAREYLTRESHFLWGRRYLLDVWERDGRPQVTVEPKRLVLTVRPGSGRFVRERVMHEWHKRLLHEMLPPLLARWQEKLGVTLRHYGLRRMKTRWGSCTPQRRSILLNTELVKKPKDLVEYVVVHELLHLIEPHHNERFYTLLTQYYPHWQDARNALNGLPLTIIN